MGKKKNKKYKISAPRFLTILAGLIALVAIIIIVSVKNAGKDDPSAIVLPSEEAGQLTPLPSLSASPTASATPVPTATPSPTLPPITPTLIPTFTPTPKPTVSPTSGLKKDPKALTKPSSSMKKNAASGVISGNNVNLRQGPSTSTPILAQSLKKNEELTVYTRSDNFYFVKINRLDRYGYISKDYVKLTSDFGEKATPTPDISKEKVPEGSKPGTVTASVVALRAEADSDSKCIAEYKKGTKVYVFSKSKDFYYVQIAGTKKTGYMYSKYINVKD